MAGVTAHNTLPLRASAGLSSRAAHRSSSAGNRWAKAPGNHSIRIARKVAVSTRCDAKVMTGVQMRFLPSLDGTQQPPLHSWPHNLGHRKAQTKRDNSQLAFLRGIWETVSSTSCDTINRRGS
eukprot:1732699-Pyramimonas_sp.AAC.1